MTNNTPDSLWTEQQWQAISRTDCNLIVTASAGSGKTTTMIERALHLVLAGTPVGAITLLTFTEAAAAEMRDKLRNRLIRAAKEEADAQVREYLVRQIDELPYANISTIHGYCYALVREFFEQIPLSPTVRVLDEDACDEFKQKAFESLLKESEGNAQFDDMRKMVGLRDDKVLYDLLNTIYEYMTNQPNREDWLEEMYRTTYACPFEEAVTARTFVDEIRRQAETARDAIASVLAQMDAKDKGRNAANTVHAISLLFADVTSMRDVYAAYGQFASAKHRVSPGNSDFARRIVDVKDALYGGVTKPAKDACGLSDYDTMVARHGEMAPFVRMLCDLTLRFQTLYTEQKTACCSVDFADLERYALRILADDGIAAEVRGRSQYVFVDEFQDTNYVQSAIIGLITPPERLFVVGDSKQCIYRFRNAEPRIFLDTLHQLEAEGKAVTFGANFRSDNGILRFVNKVFSQLMTTDFGGVDYAKTDRFDLRPQAPDHDTDAVDVYLYDKPKAEQSAPEQGVFSVRDAALVADNADDAEGLAIAKYIEAHLGEQVVVKGQTKTLQYGDFAILFVRRKAAKHVLRTLLGLGLPLNLDTFASDVGLRDVNVLLAYANVMDNYMQDYPLLTVLRSPFGGFNDAELATIRLSQAPYVPFWQAFESHAAGQDELARRARRFLDATRRYAFAASFTPLSGLFKDVLLTSGYVDYLLSKVDGVERLASLYGFVSRLDGKPFATDLPSLCTYYRTYPVEKLASVSVDSGTQRIVVSTMHGTKGLEYPVVILPCMDAKAVDNEKMTSIRLDKHLGLGVEYYDRNARVRYNTFEQYVIDRRRSANTREDRLRLLYVAMTRAQCYLFVSGKKMATGAGQVKEEENFCKWLMYARDKDPGLLRYDWMPPATSLARIERNRTPLVIDEGLSAVLDYRYPYQGAVGVGKKYTVTQLNARHHDGEVQLPSFLEWRDETSLGTLYHTVFQHVDYSATDAAAVADELSRLVAEGYVEADEAALVEPDVVAKCLALPVLQKTLGAGVDTMHEQRFVLAVDSAEIEEGTREQVLIQGVIDLLIDDGTLTLVDFKLSHRAPAALREAYRVQLSLYCRAVEKALHRKVDKCLLVEINRALVIEM